MKRGFATFLVIVLLSFSIGSAYIDASSVEATGAAVAGAALSAEAVYQVCLAIGAIVATYFAAGAVIDNEDELVALGKSFIDSIPIDDVPDGWIMSFTDAEGQEVVVGSEVIDYIQSCAYLGIIGMVAGGGPDPDPDNNKNGWRDKLTQAGQRVLDVAKNAPGFMLNMTALGAGLIYDELSNLYQKWVNGEELTEAEAAVFESLTEGTFADQDIAEQWAGSPYSYSVYVQGVYLSYDDYTMYSTYDVQTLCTTPVAGYIADDYLSDGFIDSVSFVTKQKNSILRVGFDGEHIVSSSKPGYASKTYDLTDFQSFSNFASDFVSFSYSVNCPVFGSYDDAVSYLNGTLDADAALNYAKTYRDADWLAEDSEWKGQLIDPLINTGLSLQQLIDLMKALGLSVLQNQTAPQQLADAIKGLMPGVDPAAAPELLPELLPGVSPQELPDLTPDPQLQPDPEKEPVYWPSPDAHPIADPTPGADPNPAPAPSPDPDPGLDFDFDDVVSDVSGDFSGFGLSLKDKFPFCIPWDIYYLLTKLSDAPKTPVFKLPLYLPRYGIHEDIVIDLSPFESVSKLSRAFLSLLFAFGLIKWTIAFIGMIDDNVTT